MPSKKKPVKKINIKRRANAIRAKAKALLGIGSSHKMDIKGAGTTGTTGVKISKGKSRYKEGWHTSWEGKRFYLRSGDEFKFAKECDRKKIGYLVEHLSFFYYSSKYKRIKKAIPDFYIPSKNLIVEIKGAHLLDVQNLKDRRLSIENNGYKFMVLVNGAEFKLD